VGGALLGSLIIGVGKSYLSLFLVRLAMVFPFFVMALVLVIRPWGLFGKPER
jgi:branched-subunit amino acid ABC-type transport system permease component